jgi:hypothetical protein
MLLCLWWLQVVLVRWNEPFQKLATCDTDGGIFVWIQYEGRWSVELVNDRGAQVRRAEPGDGAGSHYHNTFDSTFEGFLVVRR